jgi:hypothetical protein
VSAGHHTEKTEKTGEQSAEDFVDHDKNPHQINADSAAPLSGTPPKPLTKITLVSDLGHN